MICEVLNITPEIERVIAKKASKQKIEQIANAKGLYRMFEDWS